MTCKQALLSFFSAVFLCSVISAQERTTNSTYSSYGIGNPVQQVFVANSAMGNTGYAIAYPYALNMRNPAALGMLSNPVFETSLSSNFLTLHSGELHSRDNQTFLHNIGFGFPLTKWWGMGFGLLPFSSMGYNTSSVQELSGNETVEINSKGSGNISRFYFSNAFDLVRDTLHQFSIGVTGSYLFGTLTKERNVIPDGAESFNTKTLNSLTVSDVYFDAGLYYTRNLTEKLRGSVGVYYALGDSISMDKKRLAFNYTGNDLNVSIKDTILNDTLTGQMFLPQKIGVGMALIFNNKFTLTADFASRDWSKISLLQESPPFATANELGLGLEYTPDVKEVTNLFKTMSYRFGIRYANTHLKINSEHLNEYGITFGARVPILKSESNSSFNFSIELGERGKNVPGLIKEQFTNIMVGFTFAPHKFEKWFDRQKIN